MNQTFFKAIFFLIIICFSGNVRAESLPVLMSWNGYGQVFFGDELQMVEKWMGEKAVISEGTENCYYADFPAHPEVSFMMRGGILARVYRQSDEVANFINIKIGDSIDKVKRSFRGKTCHIGDAYYIRELKNCPLIVYPSDDGGHYYLFLNKLKTKGFILLEQGGKVHDFSAGLIDSITLKEGCW